MKVKEIAAKSVLSKSGVYDYTVNPYVGCSHSCSYCYAAFMKRFTGHREKWGSFVDVKINAPEVLAKEIEKKKPRRVWMSGVCDPYQSTEKKYQLTRRCLEILVEHNWPVTIQTKSPLVLRDIDILLRSGDAEVGFSIGTADEKIKRLLEANTPPVKDRIGALHRLHMAGIRTFAMIAPIMPGAEGLVEALADSVDYVLVDRLNYSYASRLYRENKLDWALEGVFFARTAAALKKGFGERKIPVQILF